MTDNRFSSSENPFHEIQSHWLEEQQTRCGSIQDNTFLYTHTYIHTYIRSQKGTTTAQTLPTGTKVMNYVLAYLWFNIRSGKANRIGSPRKPTVLQTLQSELHVPKALKSKADSIRRRSRKKNTTLSTIYARYEKIASINRLHTPLSSGETFRRSDVWKRTRVVGRPDAFSSPRVLSSYSLTNWLLLRVLLTSRRRRWWWWRVLPRGRGKAAQHQK